MEMRGTEMQGMKMQGMEMQGMEMHDLQGAGSWPHIHSRSLERRRGKRT
jgi:hypothetical protein